MMYFLICNESVSANDGLHVPSVPLTLNDSGIKYAVLHNNGSKGRSPVC